MNNKFTTKMFITIHYSLLHKTVHMNNKTISQLMYWITANKLCQLIFRWSICLFYCIEEQVACWCTAKGEGQATKLKFWPYNTYNIIIFIWSHNDKKDLHNLPILTFKMRHFLMHFIQIWNCSKQKDKIKLKM